MIEFPDLPGQEQEAGISFYTEDVLFSLSDESATAKWLQDAIEEEGHQPGEITFIFCSDTYLHEMNVQYLDHDTLTDVITFPYSDLRVAGDIFISVDRVQDNARDLNVPLTQELHRVMVHGVLHLMGYEDDTPEKKALMREKEDLYLATLPGG